MRVRGECDELLGRVALLILYGLGADSVRSSSGCTPTIWHFILGLTREWTRCWIWDSWPRSRNCGLWPTPMALQRPTTLVASIKQSVSSLDDCSFARTLTFVIEQATRSSSPTSRRGRAPSATMYTMLPPTHSSKLVSSE